MIDKVFNDYAQESFYEYERGPEESWVVLVDGRRIITRSNKRLWRLRSHALNAVYNHLSATVIQRLHRLRIIKFTGLSFTSDQIDEAKNRWIEEHVEIITLKEWEKRNEMR